MFVYKYRYLPYKSNNRYYVIDNLYLLKLFTPLLDRIIDYLCYEYFKGEKSLLDNIMH